MPEDDCIFCKIVAGELPATVVDEDERTVAFMDINPATRGHVLVIPREHSRNIFDVAEEDLEACSLTAQRVARRQREKLAADGVNLLNSSEPVAWQTVFHFHLHVPPRYNDDPLKLPWVPGAGDMDEIRATGAELARG
jgi:histidine triad (HIT) family protein